MYLKIGKKKLEVVELTKFWERLKGLKFCLEELDYGIKFPKKKLVSTIFLCQRIDIIMTGKEDQILYLYSNVKTEKYFFPKFRVKDVYFLPLGTAKEFKRGDKLVISEK